MHVDLQARAGGGRLPQLYEATVHLQLRLGLVSRLLSQVSGAAHHWWVGPELKCQNMLCRSYGLSATAGGQQSPLLHTSCTWCYHV